MIESRAPGRMRHSWEARCRLVRLVLDGVSPSVAAITCGTSRATAYRALARYRAGGWEALRDRAPIARSHPARLSSEAERQIVDLRRATGWGPKRLAGVLGRPAATIWRVLRRHGISRRAAFPYHILWGERQIVSVANLTRKDGIDFLAAAAHADIRTHTTVFPLDQANEALARLRDGRLTGAAVLRP